MNDIALALLGRFWKTAGYFLTACLILSIPLKADTVSITYSATGFAPAPGSNGSLVSRTYTGDLDSINPATGGPTLI